MKARLGDAGGVSDRSTKQLHDAVALIEGTPERSSNA